MNDAMNTPTMRIILLLFGVSIASRAQNYCQNSKENNNCLCLSSLDGSEYHCPGGPVPDIIVMYHNKDVIIQGNNEHLETYENVTLPNINASNATFLQIKYCPYINVTQLVDKFQTKNIQIFKLKSSTYRNTELIITKEYLSSINQVQYLEITDSFSLILEKNFLEDHHNLRILNLNRNNLVILDNYFTNSTNLITNINLSDNQITYIPENIFQNVTQLKRLELWHNNLTGLTDYAFFGLENLKTLELSFNHLQEISENVFSSLTGIEELSLRRNNLGKLHENTFKNNKLLKKLRLDLNSRLELSNYLLSNLTSLTEVSLDSSNIDFLPEQLFDGSYNITKITASNNNLEILPTNIFKDLINLSELNLSQNKLKLLPIFATMPKLNSLMLAGNRLKTIGTRTFQGLVKLKTLDLQNNSISNIEPQAFFDLEDVKSLNLSRNKWSMPLQENGATPINDCLNVQEIKLDHNKIDRFPDELFTNLVEIRHVNLSYNSISEVTVKAFAKVLGNELTVDLSNTEIDFLDFEKIEVKWATVWLSEIQARSNLNESNYEVPAITNLYLNNTKVLCNCTNYGLLLYNAGFMPNLKKLVEIDQRSMTCIDSFENPLELEPGHCSYQLRDCPSKCSCNYRPFNRTLNVDCSRRNLTSSPKLNVLLEWYFRYNQTTVDLSGNFLTSGPEDNSYNNVTIMNLANNSIDHMSYVPPRIQKIHLENNKLSHLNRSYIETLTNVTDFRRITLKGNPWACDCNSQPLQYFLQKHHRKVDGSELRCPHDNALLSQALNLCPPSYILTVALPLCLSVFLILSIMLTLYYRFQEDIRIYLFHKGWLLWLISEDELDKDKLYDVFISFAHQDDDFVDKILLNELENGEPRYKVCIHARDWEPGECIQTHVLRSVKESRRTVIVLTNDFLDSMWGKYEFKTAHTEAITQGMTRVVVIIKGELDEEKLDEEMKNYLKNNTYVKWGDKYFWHKLKYALPHSVKRNYERNKEHNRKHANMMLKIDQSIDKFHLVSSPSPTNNSTPPLTLDPGLLKVKDIETIIIDGEEPLFKKL